MALVLKSNKSASASMGNIYGILGASDYSLFLDFENDVFRRKTASGEIVNTNIDEVLSVTQPHTTQYLDDNGAWQDAPPNTARIHKIQDINKKGLVVENVRRNLFLNSESPTTQTITASYYEQFQLVITGTGTAEITGAVSDVTGAATQGNPAFGKFENGSVTITITGNVTSCYLYQSPYARNFSDVTPVKTENSAVLRQADLIEIRQSILSDIVSENGITIVAQVAYPVPYTSFAARYDGIIARLYNNSQSGYGGYDLRNTFANKNQARILFFDDNATGHNDLFSASILPIDSNVRVCTVAAKISSIDTNVAKSQSLGVAISEEFNQPQKMLLGSTLSGNQSYPATIALDGVITKLIIFDRAISDTELAKISASWE